MNRRHFKRNSSKRDIQSVALWVAIVIGAILVVAAYGKLFYPAPFLKNLERGISVFEILLIGAILFFRRHWQLWLAAAVIFAGWFGYAFFWYTLKLPCNCMGTLFSIPTGFWMVLDFLLFCSSMAVGHLLGAKRKQLQLSLMGSFLMGLIGFGFADLIYHWSI